MLALPTRATLAVTSRSQRAAAPRATPAAARVVRRVSTRVGRASLAPPRAASASPAARASIDPSLARRASRARPVVVAAAAAGEADAPPETAVKRSGSLKINLPTWLTLARVAAVPVVTAIFYARGAWVCPTCCVVFVAAAVTDWADGYLARKLNLVSSFGAFLDPVADKLMVAAALVLLCTIPPAGVPAWRVAAPATIIIGREITMSAIREWAAAAGGEAHGAVAVNSYGKWKTATQLVAISVLLGVRDGTAWMGLADGSAAASAVVTGGVWCLFASAALALLSLWIYMAGVIGYMD
jgi:CDP-diacylglycerol--glycerol-3-phosphate 3-phosphatidyltransferase